jgi:hypothetical protein
MPGASRTARSALRARGHRGGVPARSRPAAGAGLRSGGGAAPGGLPPVGRGFPAALGIGELPADPPSFRALISSPLSRNLARWHRVLHGLVLAVARYGSRAVGVPLIATVIAAVVTGKRADDLLIRSLWRQVVEGRFALGGVGGGWMRSARGGTVAALWCCTLCAMHSGMEATEALRSPTQTRQSLCKRGGC